MKKALLAVLACGAVLVGTTACGTTNTTVSNPVEETTSGVVSQMTTKPEYKKPESIKTADDAKAALIAGNKAFMDGNIDIKATNTDRKELAEGQKPYAVVITCSDSRVPPELIFNSGLGEIFTIRTAGNVVADFETGSVEYGVDHLNAPLVVVMGHSKCGAVAGAVDGHATGHVEDIIKDITPSVDKARETAKGDAEITSLAENLNVEHSIAKLRESEILSKAEKEGKIKIVGAKYDITTGEVTYL